MVMVPELALILWLSVTLLPPASAKRIALPDTIPVVPMVLPMLLMPKLLLPPPAAPPLMVMALPFCESVILLPPASVRVPVETNAPAPEVLPEMVALMRPPLTGGIYVMLPQIIYHALPSETSVRQVYCRSSEMLVWPSIVSVPERATVQLLPEFSVRLT